MATAWASRSRTATAFSALTVPSASPVHSCTGPRSAPTANRNSSMKTARPSRRHGRRSPVRAATSAPSLSPIWNSKACRPMFGPYSARARPKTRPLRPRLPCPARPPTHPHARRRTPTISALPCIARRGARSATTATRAPMRGTYTGFQALFGNVNVAPVICAAAPAACSSGNVKDTDGAVIADAYGRPGFPNIFSPVAKQSLGYAATMLEAGIPVVYVYLADGHDRNPVPLDPATNLPGPSHAFGAGEAEYVAQLKAYDLAFGKFFARLAADGITKDNTLFFVTADENDHFVGGAPSPANCDGIHVPCSYAQIGEITTFLDRLLLTQRGNTTPFDIHFDDAPTFYIHGNPAPTDTLTRTVERDVDALQVTNPITGRVEKLNAFLADRAEMTLLQILTSNPARSPSFTMFGNPDYFNTTSSASTGKGTDCSQAPACVNETPGFAWNHGDVQTDITRTWMGMVGPGVSRSGRDDHVFSDHTDLRPTMIALAGLKDDSPHDARAS